MKNIVLFIIAALLIISCNQNPRQESVTGQAQSEITDVNTPGDGVFIHITESYNDPHRVLMPLKMAVLMADDKDVIVYMDIHAVELLVKGAKDLNFSEFESFQTYLKQLMDKGVDIFVCPTCLKVAGYNPEDLMEGIQVAQKDKFFSFTKGRILTLDY